MISMLTSSPCNACSHTPSLQQSGPVRGGSTHLEMVEKIHEDKVPCDVSNWSRARKIASERQRERERHTHTHTYVRFERGRGLGELHYLAQPSCPSMPLSDDVILCIPIPLYKYMYVCIYTNTCTYIGNIHILVMSSCVCPYGSTHAVDCRNILIIVSTQSSCVHARTTLRRFRQLQPRYKD